MVSMAIVAVLMIGGCGPGGESGQGTNAYQGRQDTKALLAASAAGYDGVAIRKKVDQVLNKADEQLKDFEQATSTNQ